jgi:hypothetical protein
MGKKLKIQIVLPFLLILISLSTMRLINFKPAITPSERQILEFIPEMLEIDERQPLIISEDLKSPIEIVKTPAKGFPSIPLSALVPEMEAEEESYRLNASMIVISKRKMAIMNGLVVKEGDSIGGMKILKIEKDRILLKDFSQKDKVRWVYLEGIK